MSMLVQSLIIYASVALAVLYLARGTIMKLMDKKDRTSTDGCGSCDSGGCATCKSHFSPNSKQF